MFGRRFFGGRFWGARYWGDGGTAVAVVPEGGPGRFFNRDKDDDEDPMELEDLMMVDLVSALVTAGVI